MLLKTLYDLVRIVAGNTYYQFTPPVTLQLPHQSSPLHIYCIQATTDGKVDIYTSIGDERLEPSDKGYKEIYAALVQRLRYLNQATIVEPLKQAV